MENEELQEQEFRYCLVGNIVQEREYGENHEIVKGTKAFRPGTKVYVSPSFCGDGGENRYVIGLSRHKKYIKIVTEIKFIENFRFQKVYKPVILKLMNEKEYYWWKNTEEDRMWIYNEVHLLNSEENPYKRRENFMFKHNSTRFITEKEFINHVVTDIVDNLDDEGKQNWIDNPEYDHFGRGMWIRNEYLWGQNLPFIFEPDDMSEVIFNKVIEALKEN